MQHSRAGERRRRRRSEVTPFDRTLVTVVALGAGMAAAGASAAPSGLPAADLLYRTGLAAVVSLATARARRWSWLLLAAVATATAHGLLLVPAGAALVLSFLASMAPVRYRLGGAVVGALAVQALLRQPSIGFHGASMLIGALAVVPVLVSGQQMCRPSVQRRNVRGVLALAGLAVVATAAFGVAALVARTDLQLGADEARAALTAARRGDTAAARARLRTADAALRTSDSSTGAWWAAPARAVPIVGHQAAAVDVVTDEARRVVRSARVTAEVGDYDRLKYRSGRFDLDQVRQLRRPLAASAGTVERADRRLRALDRGWLLPPLGDRVRSFADEVERAAPEARVASSVVDVAPGLLGGDGVRHYFVAFITPSELRGAGGFVGNYGELTAADGKVRLTRSGPIADLILAAKPGSRLLEGPADYLRRYGGARPADYFQDVTFSPNFPFDAEVIEQLYPQSGGTKVDGVISVDPVALAALLRFTGPITVPGLSTPLTSANAADILLRQQYLQPGTRADRKDLLVEASRITFEKLTTGDLPPPQELARVLGPMVDQRRIMLHSVRAPEQRLFGRIAADGALPKADGGDVLAVASQNSGNNKIDAFLQRNLTYRTTVDPATGAVRSTLEVRLRNDAPSTGLPPIFIGNSRNLPTGTNAMTLQVHSPLDLRTATLDGRPLPMNSDTEAGLQVYSAPVRIPAGSTRVVRLELAGGVDLRRRGYRLIVVPQPMVNADRLSVSVGATRPWRARPDAHMVASGPSAAVRAVPLTGISNFEVKFSR